MKAEIRVGFFKFWICEVIKWFPHKDLYELQLSDTQTAKYKKSEITLISEPINMEEFI